MGRPNPGQAPPRLKGLVLDAGALIAFEHRGREISVLMEQARARGEGMFIPAGVLAQVWRDGTRQARLARLLRSASVSVEDLTAGRARAVGELCVRRGTADVIDASVALAARQHGGVVVSGDPEDLLRLDPTLDIVKV